MATPSLYARDSFSTETPRFYIGLDLLSTNSEFSKFETEYTDTLGVTTPLIIDQSFESDGEVNGAAIRLGFHFTNFLAAEIQFSKPQEIELTDGTTFNADTTASAFLRFDFPFRKVIPYVMAGGTYMAWRYETPDLVAGTGTIEIRETSTGPAFGGGLEIYGGEHTAFNISFIRYITAVSDNDGEFTHDSLNLGIVHWFEFPNLYRRF
jgi:hypothetical protein